MTGLLEVSELSVRYDGKIAVENATLTVGNAEIVTIIGHNGAGKSSLLMTIHGHVRGTGSIRFDGEDITRLSPERRLALGIGLVPQGHQVFRTLSTRENLEIVQVADRKRRKESLDSVFDIFPILRERHNQLAGTMSGGQQQMLAIAMGLISEPTLLLVDEPTIGLAPSLVKQVMDDLSRIRDTRGCSVLLVEQRVTESLALADRAYGMRRGEIVAESPASEFADRFDLMDIM